MRIVQVLAFVIFSALLVAGGAWALAWWGTPRPPDPIEAGLEARPEIKSPGALETAPERRSTGEIQAAPAPKSVSATVHLNSDPRGADATTSRGSGCRTPCSIIRPGPGIRRTRTRTQGEDQACKSSGQSRRAAEGCSGRDLKRWSRIPRLEISGAKGQRLADAARQADPQCRVSMIGVAVRARCGITRATRHGGGPQ